MLEEHEFALLYTQNGGSGTNLTRADYLDLDVDRMLRWSARLEAERQREHKAQRDAQPRFRSRK